MKTHSLEHEHILSGIIKCPLCGAGMTGTVYRRHNKKTDEYKDTLYERMTDLEKKQFMRTFIESIELYPEKKDSGRIISTIELKFPVYYDGQEGNEIRMPDKNTVETVV